MNKDRIDKSSPASLHLVHGSTVLAGRLGVVMFGLHVAWCAMYDHVADSLWVCHVAFLILSLGLWFASARMTGIGGLCLLVGAPAWVANIAAGLEVGPTSAITHLGGFALAVFGFSRLGVARRIWLLTPLFLGVLQLGCRLVTPPAQNINAAFEVYEPLKPLFSSYAAYEATLLVSSLVVFLALEVSLCRVFGPAATGRPAHP